MGKGGGILESNDIVSKCVALFLSATVPIFSSADLFDATLVTPSDDKATAIRCLEPPPKMNTTHRNNIAWRRVL